MAAPRTPTKGLSPNCSSIFYAPSRKSTDSWNSSNADELEWEWKQDQVLLLSRTLDALPAHIVTPFNGPIPPPNLLDKIARGVSSAKGPIDWPHSIRATRVKLIELARNKAKEEAEADRRRQTIAEEPEVQIDDGSHYSYVQDGAERPVAISARRPIYKQSSMDFLEPAGADLKHNNSIAKLSRRLQRTDRAFPNPAFHPYARGSQTPTDRRSTSPPPLTKVPSLISPSTDSSDTLNSLESYQTAPRALRCSVSSLSSISMFSGSSSGPALPNPAVQRLRAESVSAAPPKFTSRDTAVGHKRAPTYGALAQGVKIEQTPSPGQVRRDSGSYPSSDEEEKARTKHAKKARTKTTPPPAKFSVPASPAVAKRPESPLPPPLPEKDRKHLVKTRTRAPVQDENAKIPSPPQTSRTRKVPKVDGALGQATENPANYKRPPPMNPQRNPSMFGPELPHLRAHKSATPKASPMHIASPAKVTPNSPMPLSPAKHRGIAIAMSPPTPNKTRMSSDCSPLSPSPLAQSPAMLGSPMALSPAQSPPPTQRVRTLRRVQRLVPARRISFGSMLSSNDGDTAYSFEGNCLGSAFQLL